MQNNYDVLIIGTGIAGLSAALKLAEKKLNVAIITREEKPEVTNTYWAQGGIIYSPLENGDVDSLIEDIQKASSNTSNTEAARVIAEKSAGILKDILIDKVKTEFNIDAEGELLL